MLPVTRANLDHICCICLMDTRPSIFTQKVYDVKKENNISKILKLTAHITILKNPLNQKYINEYCRKICEICFVKAQYSYFFREKIMAATATLKELLESNDLNEQDVERLHFFCRICLNRQKTTKDIKYLNMTHLNWLKYCSGIRFTTLIDTETFRIKEGTNINEIALINDKHFPKQLCPNCFKKLQNVEEFRKSATQSFDYMISVMGQTAWPEDFLMAQDVQFKESIIWRKEPQPESVLDNMMSAKQDCVILQTDYVNYEKEKDSCSTNGDQYQTLDSLCDVESMISTSNMQPLEDDTFEDVLDLMDDLSPYSDKDLNLNNNDFSDSSDNSRKSRCLRKTRAKKSRQCNVNNEKNLKSKEENVETSNAFKPKLRLCKSVKDVEYSPQKCTRKLKENETLHADNIENSEVDSAKETYVCEVCSKIFARRYTYKRHLRNVHASESTRTMHECLICSNKFKSKSHLTHHIKTVHEKLRPFKCSYCTKTFSASSSKRVHELTHTEDYPFACKWCGKGFRQSSQLKIHSEIHTTNPELLCPICKRSQKSQNDLENHLKRHNDKRLQCPLCGKFFTRNYHLKDHHNAVHLKLRPFKCEFCELAFGDRKTRKSHEKSHTEDRPITCNVCKSGFKTNFSLSRHINKFGHKTENSESTNNAGKKNSHLNFKQQFFETYVNH